MMNCYVKCVCLCVCACVRACVCVCLHKCGPAYYDKQMYFVFSGDDLSLHFSSWPAHTKPVSAKRGAIPIWCCSVWESGVQLLLSAHENDMLSHTFTSFTGSEYMLIGIRTTCWRTQQFILLSFFSTFLLSLLLDSHKHACVHTLQMQICTE